MNSEEFRIKYYEDHACCPECGTLKIDLRE